jgi:hypothetical protein
MSLSCVRGDSLSSPASNSSIIWFWPQSRDLFQGVELAFQLHNRSTVQQTVRISNHQYPRLFAAVCEHKLQIGCILSYPEDWFAPYRSTSSYGGCQPYTAYARRFQPAASLRVQKISLNPLLILRFMSFVSYLDRDPHQMVLIAGRKLRHSLHFCDDKAHLVVALLLPHRYNPLWLCQRDRQQHAHVDHPDTDNPHQPRSQSLSFARNPASSSYQRYGKSCDSNAGPACDSQQQKLR